MLAFSYFNLKGSKFFEMFLKTALAKLKICLKGRLFTFIICRFNSQKVLLQILYIFFYFCTNVNICRLNDNLI